MGHIQTFKLSLFHQIIKWTPLLHRYSFVLFLHYLLHSFLIFVLVNVNTITKEDGSVNLDIKEISYLLPIHTFYIFIDNERYTSDLEETKDSKFVERMVDFLIKSHLLTGSSFITPLPPHLGDSNDNEITTCIIIISGNMKLINLIVSIYENNLWCARKNRIIWKYCRVDQWLLKINQMKVI